MKHTEIIIQAKALQVKERKEFGREASLEFHIGAVIAERIKEADGAETVNAIRECFLGKELAEIQEILDGMEV